jgi:molecular chaperone DnaK
MKYVGIDLGTTNSAICSYDGQELRLYKSPDTNDVTPSAIFIDRRGNKYVGSRAYNSAPRNPDNAATLFKRLMGTSTPVKLPAVNLVMKPEECSAEILRTLVGYLPEEYRGEDTGTVITVPAAFNQMQKDATMAAAEMAGIGLTSLMQEPVAAIMAVMRQRKTDGVFLVFDLGGGTLDVAIAENTAGRVKLLAHGGIQMCGGRDFDRALFDGVVKPWLQQQFELPEDLAADPQYRSLLRMATWAAEKGKIELSQKKDASIALNESELGVRDRAGNEVYLDIPIDQARYNALIAPKLDESIQAAREALEKAGLSPHDVERIVFVGGPTQYKPLRDKIAFELGIAPSTDVNPMTAVAEGAAVFAESIEWSSQSRGRKSSRGSVAAGGKLGLGFEFIARTPDVKARVMVRLAGRPPQGCEFQIDSLDTGTTSGRIALKDGASLDLDLARPGENSFKVFVFDPAGGPIPIDSDRLVITRTAASIDAIPASHSIAIEARDSIGGRPVLDYLVREGEQLPRQGRKVFKAEHSLRAGGAQPYRFKLWEGDIDDPIDDNTFIGVFEIRGNDFEHGSIAAGADLICDYEVLDSGNITLEVTVPSISGSFRSSRNFYSRQEGQIDFSKASRRVEEESQRVQERLNEISSAVDDPKLGQVQDKLDSATRQPPERMDAEATKEAMQRVEEAKRLLARTRAEHLRKIRQLELDKTVRFFEDSVRKHARPSEVEVFEKLSRTAQSAIDNGAADFEARLRELRGKNFVILWRQDWFVIDRFKWLAGSAHLFHDEKEHARWVKAGQDALKANDMDRLREAVDQLDSIRFSSNVADEMAGSTNILRSRS